MNDIMKYYQTEPTICQNIPKPYSYLITYLLLYLVTFLNPYYIMFIGISNYPRLPYAVSVLNTKLLHTLTFIYLFELEKLRAKYT